MLRVVNPVRSLVFFLMVGLLTVLLAPQGVAQASSLWTPTGSMSTPRAGAAAILLPNGKVLVAGGAKSTGVLSSAELYDPSSGTWTTTGSMNVPRYSSFDGPLEAVLLQNGKVLVAGGVTSNQAFLSSAELYDPSTGQWTYTGSMNSPRYYYTLTLLSNGNVLAAGGYGNGDLASAELYYPSTGQWSTTGSMKQARLAHTATLLPNGKVLVTGGSYNGGYTMLSSAELYDPNTGQWSTTGSMNELREDHGAVLLQSGKVLVTGGRNFLTNTATSELYDPSMGQWTYTGSMNTPRNARSTTTLLYNGKVLVAGSDYYITGTYTAVNLSSAELYDPQIGSWTATDSMIVPGGGTNTLLSNGQVLAAGTGGTLSAELYGVPFNWSGFLQPINSDGSSIFKLGSTVPVKFQYTVNNTPVGDVIAKLYIAQISNGIEGTVLEAVSTAAADSGNTFRYDSTSQQYIFNLGTKGLTTTGTYRLKVYVGGDNTTGVLQGQVDISLK